MQIIFRYKPFKGYLAPIITIGIRMNATWYPIGVYADSGSVYTVLHAQIANGIGFNYLAGERIFIQVGDGGYIPVYLHDLDVQIGTERFIGKIGFSEKLGVGFNLLGRKSFFDRFKICFQESLGIITFEP